MESLFFNLGERKYKKSSIDYGVQRVDISQGLLYISTEAVKRKREFTINYIDKMLIIFVVKDGKIILNRKDKKRELKKDTLALFSLNGQKTDIIFESKSEVFILFIADFFLKNYLSSFDDIVNLLYKRVQSSRCLDELCSCSLDTVSSFLINKLLNIDKSKNLYSLKAEILSLELIVHFLEIITLQIKGFNDKDFALAKRAKELLEKEYVNPPTIKELAKYCQTNETKLKKTFKQVYNSTIYNFIQDLRLKKAYYLLKVDGLSVGEAAKEVGYMHQGNFSKLFKKRFGIEPSMINKNPILAKKC